MTTIQTFYSNPNQVDNAIIQCVAFFADLGCGAKITRNKKSVRVTSEQKIKNNDDGQLYRPSFQIIITNKRCANGRLY